MWKKYRVSGAQLKHPFQSLLEAYLYARGDVEKNTRAVWTVSNIIMKRARNSASVLSCQNSLFRMGNSYKVRGVSVPSPSGRGLG